jgi:hypothetical protein
MWELANLVPDHVGQGADELRGGVAVALERLLVDHLADGEPEGGFEALGGLVFALCMAWGVYIVGREGMTVVGMSDSMKQMIFEADGSEQEQMGRRGSWYAEGLQAYLSHLVILSVSHDGSHRSWRLVMMVWVW